MKMLPVSKCIDILNVYYTHENEDLWVNRIVKKVNEATGSRDSPAIKRAIKYLEDGNILGTKKVNKQKELKILTQLGIEIKDLFYNVNSIHDKFSSLQKQIKEYEKLIKDDEHVRRNLLLNSGWTKNDLNFFDEFTNTLNSVTELYVKNICNLLIYRFKIISDFKDVNEISKIILSRILSDELINQFDIVAKAKSVSIVKKDVEDQDPDTPEKVIFHHSHGIHSLSLSFWHQLEEIYLYNFLPKNKKIQENIENLLKAMISITNDDKIEIKNLFKKENQVIYRDPNPTNLIEIRKILLEKKFDPIYYSQLINTKIYEENILDLINLYNDILKNQKNNLKQKERTYQLK